MCPDKKRPAENTCRIVKGLDAVWAHFCSDKTVSALVNRWYPHIIMYNTKRRHLQAYIVSSVTFSRPSRYAPSRFWQVNSRI